MQTIKEEDNIEIALDVKQFAVFSSVLLNRSILNEEYIKGALEVLGILVGSII